MQLKALSAFLLTTGSIFLLTCCSETTSRQQVPFSQQHGGYATQVEWGHHLIETGGCGDCHTPKKITAAGPVHDSSLLLSGHPSDFPLPELDRSSLESRGIAATQTLTFWIGPWGVSYAANLTPDSTGLLAWSEEQFITSLREGVAKGIKGNRPVLPPMPVNVTKKYTTEELKAMFAYLKTIKPVKNIVPQPMPPVMPPPPPASGN